MGGGGGPAASSSSTGVIAGTGGGGGSGACTSDAACNDSNPCTTDTCDLATSTCVTVPLPQGGGGPGPEQVPGDCQVIVCDASGGVTFVGDGTDLPADDGTQCTAEVCINDQPTHDPAPAGSPCELGGLCDGSGSCVECVDDGDCNGFDTCGGGGVMSQCGCTPLDCQGAGATCGTVADGCGDLLGCNDGAKNGTETDIDCGGGADGTCAENCANGNACVSEEDCADQCVDGVCCNSNCDGVCRSCALPGSVGMCTVVPALQDDLPGCTGTMTCTGNGNNACKLKNGQSCTLASQCASGNCVAFTCT
jgi:hypothetical protein